MKTNLFILVLLLNLASPLMAQQYQQQYYNTSSQSQNKYHLQQQYAPAYQTPSNAGPWYLVAGFESMEFKNGLIAIVPSNLSGPSLELGFSQLYQNKDKFTCGLGYAYLYSSSSINNQDNTFSVMPIEIKANYFMYVMEKTHLFIGGNLGTWRAAATTSVNNKDQDASKFWFSLGVQFGIQYAITPTTYARVSYGLNKIFAEGLGNGQQPSYTLECSRISASLVFEF